jgi:Domain of unknown function (DUF222)
VDADRPLLTADAARENVSADLDVIDAALARLRETSTDLVGNAFRIDVAERLETQSRANRGLSYRMFGEIVEPPDGAGDTGPRAGARVRDQLWMRLRVTPAEIRRRMRLAVRIRPRRTLTGEPLPPELPELAAAVEAGDVGEDHIREVCKALDALPNCVSMPDKEKAERVLVEHAAKQDSAFVAVMGRRIADILNPDGVFDERDRANRRALSLGTQGPDGMSRLSGWLTPEARAYLEAVGAAVRPGRHHPDTNQPVVDAEADGRTPSQRLHDAFALALKAGIASGELGLHRGIPVTVIATTTVAELEQAARAVADPSIPMPRPAHTGGGSALPMRDLIAMASDSIHYLAVFDEHSGRPLYLGRSKRIATADQRIICYARDHGCTRPNCLVPGYDCEVHHAPGWHSGGRSDADKLFFACGGDNARAEDDDVSTTVTEDGRLAWSHGADPPQVNRLHHPEEWFDDDGDP